MKACKVVSTHDPDRPDIRQALAEIAERVDGAGGAEVFFDTGHIDRRVRDDAADGIETGVEIGQIRVVLQRIARRHQQPDPVEFEPLQGHHGDVPVAGMGRVERTAEQADAQTRCDGRQARHRGHGRRHEAACRMND